jgi:SH3-like domain-containing protein
MPLISFTSHNIRLDDGSYTKPEAGPSMDVHPWFLAAKRIIDVTFPGDKRALKLVDLGCLEGGYTVEFARLGIKALGLDVRESNIEACRYVQSKVNLPNLDFVKDDVWNTAKYGPFDITFCCGLFYHVDKPRELLQLLSTVTQKLLILQTHFSEAKDSPPFIRPRRLRRALSRVLPLRNTGTTTHKLSFMSENEGLPGRWVQEFNSSRAFRDRENRRWASWNNRTSFWVQREYLLQAMRDSGFDVVLEQYDALGSEIAYEMTEGSYRSSGRSTFIGIKSAYAASDPRTGAAPGLRRE